MDLRVFAFRRRVYDVVLRDLWRNYSGNLDAGVLYHRMLERHGDLHICHRFPLQAQLQGISGRHQRDYSGFSQRSKDAIRSGLRRLIPWLWL